MDAHGYPPTVREIGEAVGLASPSTVHAHLANLERAGLLKRDPTKPRALDLIGRERRVEQPRDDSHRLPLLGQIAAGGPLLAEQDIEDYVTIDESLARGDFVLRVKGDSMIDAGILSGDYIFVRKQLTAQRGEIVVALIGDEATVKYFYPEKDYVRFQPANKTMAPILVRAMDFKPTMLLGVVVGVFRRI